MIDKQHLIDLKGVSKEFDGTRVLSNIDLYVRRKEFVTLLGPSGCGKTTTLRIIGGFEYPTEGTVLFEGRDVRDLPRYKSREMTVVQKYALRQLGISKICAVSAPLLSGIHRLWPQDCQGATR